MTCVLPRRILLLHNPGSRAGEEKADAAAAALEAGGATVEGYACAGREETIAHLRSEAPRFDAVAACGGDGTMNTVANALAETETALGLIPSGTANDLARTLGVPDDPAAAAAIILAGAERSIDLGEVNGCYFLNVASIGLSVALARTLTKDLKRRWGKLSYALAALDVARRARPFHAIVAGDEELARVRSYQIAVGNGRFYGGGMAVKDDAAIDDGRLDLYSLEARSLFRLALMLPAFRTGEHGLFSAVRTAEGAWFEIRTRRPMAVNADGEIVAHTPARFHLHRCALRVFAPAAGGAAA